MNAVDTIMATLTKALAPFDAKVIASEIECLIARRPAVKEVQQATQGEDAFRRYPKLFEAAGGKGNFHILIAYTNNGIVELLQKSGAIRAANRNAKIAAKLAKAGITEVLCTEVLDRNDGFNITVKVNNDQYVTINTIFAGGYNIQCAHLRVLCSVR